MYCVFFPFILDIKFVGRTSRSHTGGRSHRISHPPFWGVGVMCGWCLAYCTGVVLNTVGESAMPDSKENKQADAGSRRFRRHFLCGALCVIFYLQSMKVYLHIHVQREWSAEPFMPSILSLRIFCTAVLSRCKCSPPTVCVLCFLPIHSGHQVRWTYQPGSHRISHPPPFCGACLNFSRKKDSAVPFPRRP